MNQESFKKWCESKESNLWKYRFNKLFEVVSVFIALIGSVYVTILFNDLTPPTLKFFDYINKNISQVAVFIISITLLGFVISKLSEYLDEFKRNEVIACTLFKLSKNMVIHNNQKEIKNSIKFLDKISKFSISFPSDELFKRQNKEQSIFYENLKNLSSRLLYLLENNKLSTIKSTQIEKLAYYIFLDDKSLVKELDLFTKTHPELYISSKKRLSMKLKTASEKKWIMIICWIIILLILSFLIYNYLGIDKNSVFLGFIGLLGVIAYIIYKK